jgi:hypothetical protein
MAWLASIGSIVPGWVRERARCEERLWPLRILAAALVVVTLANLWLLGMLWTADAPVYYVPP